jgi:hypothetical protein
MSKRFSTVLLILLSFLLSSQLASTQSAPLTVVSTGPSGELQQLEQANEIRVIFSEPMVSLGRIPTNPMPSWIRITPAIAGTFRWSGTTILMFTPDQTKSLPYATRYSVTIDRTATSATGRALAQPVMAELKSAVGLRNLASRRDSTSKKEKASVPAIKQYREKDGTFHVKLNDASGRALFDSAFASPQEAGAAVARLRQGNTAGIPMVLEPGVGEGDVKSALAELANA